MFIWIRIRICIYNCNCMCSSVIVSAPAHTTMNYEARSAVHMLPINHSSQMLHSLTFYRQQLGNQINVTTVAFGGRSAHSSDSCQWQPYRTYRAGRAVRAARVCVCHLLFILCSHSLLAHLAICYSMLSCDKWTEKSKNINNSVSLSQ